MKKNISQSSNEKSQISGIARTFTSQRRNLSEKFLDEIFSLRSGEQDILDIASDVDISLALRAIDANILSAFVERQNCPNWLGAWIAKHGAREVQMSYLFRPNLSEDVSIADRLSRRPSEVKRLFWSSGSRVVVSSLVNFDDELYLAWARDIGFDGDIREPNLEPEGDGEFIPSVRDQISSWLEKRSTPVTEELWQQHVPKQGACAVLQGEMARCIGRLENEYWENGMINMGDGYYDRMVDKVRKTVATKNSFSQLVKRILAIDCAIVKGADYSKLRRLSLMQHSGVEEALHRMSFVVAAWCLKNAEPIPYKPKAWD